MTSVHLLVVVHGMWGNPSHLSELNRIIQEAHAVPNSDGVALEVMLAEKNCMESTYDGIDWGGERVAQEILDKVVALKDCGKNVVKFSVTGYSQGGLVARYAIGVLYQRGFFRNVTPFNFNTIATPHLGLPRYPTIMAKLFISAAPSLLSRTGEQFYNFDRWSTTGLSLLEVMADPDQIFYQALASFKYLRIYANAINDVTVPYITSAIEEYDPFMTPELNGLEVDIDEEYEPLIKQYTIPPVPPHPIPKATILSPKWLRDLLDRPRLPPSLQFRFPFNIVLYATLPILIPLGSAIIVIYSIIATRSSHARIRLLENDPLCSQRLSHTLAKLEINFGNAVLNLIDDPYPMPIPNPFSNAPKLPAERPYLTSRQQKIAESLNTLPIKKELAYIRDVRDSHAAIVCRGDMKRFKEYWLGEGILRHWAASFVL